MQRNIQPRFTYYIVLLITIFITSCTSQNRFPKPIGYVNDFAQILTPTQIKSLGTKIADYDASTTNQIAVVTLSNDTITKDNYEKIALNLSNEWGVGTKEKNNGLTIILFKNVNKIRISTGTGTQNILTDDICSEVLHTVMIPEFLNDNFYEGIDKGIDEFIKRWKE